MIEQKTVEVNLGIDIFSSIPYDMLKDVLVKPLEPIMVTKEVTEMIPTGNVDSDNIEDVDTKTEVKEVESNFSRGIVLSLPKNMPNDSLAFDLGDTIIYPKRSSFYFDLFKDSQLVKPYDVVAVEKKK